jgi:hypothetical protein
MSQHLKLSVITVVYGQKQPTNQPPIVVTEFDHLYDRVHGLTILSRITPTDTVVVEFV